MGFTKGQKVTLKNVTSYESSTTSHKGKTRTGTYYIWSAATKNGRIRITEKKSYCGKSPASKYVLCWVKTSSISTSKNKNEKEPETTAEAKTKKTTDVKNERTKTTVASMTPAISVAVTDTEGQIGYLGKVIFVVRADILKTEIKTVSNFTYTMSASYAEHDRHLKPPLLEFTGIDSQTITFDIELSVYLGQKSVESSLKELYEYMKKGTKLHLKLGKKSYGPYRWCIKQLVLNGKTTDKDGNWTTAKLAVSLISTEKK